MSISDCGLQSTGCLLFVAIAMSPRKPSTTWLVKEDAFPESGMCKYAQAAPKIRPTGDTTADQEMNFMRSDLQWIIDRLMREPGHIGAVKGT